MANLPVYSGMPKMDGPAEQDKPTAAAAATVGGKTAGGVDGAAAGAPAKVPGSEDPLHGVTLEMMLTRLVDYLGWEEMSARIRIRCFANDPSIGSSLKFLRKTQWARRKVEELYSRYDFSDLKKP